MIQLLSTINSDMHWHSTGKTALRGVNMADSCSEKEVLGRMYGSYFTSNASINMKKQMGTTTNNNYTFLCALNFSGVDADYVETLSDVSTKFRAVATFVTIYKQLSPRTCTYFCDLSSYKISHGYLHWAIRYCHQAKS